jgi:NAD(P)-dependent dehydrogenase (short-subunit alcohol dehydrogenase family)
MEIDKLMFRDGLMDGERILVTGGGTGLGKVMTEAFLKLGAEVHICGRRKGKLDETAQQMMDAHDGTVVGHACDIRDADAIKAMVDAIWERGPLTGVVNNAAGNFVSRTEDLSVNGFNAISDIVFRGTFYVTLEVGKRLIAERRKASFLSILTTWVWNGSAFVVPSAMSKAGINAMMQSLAVEWGRLWPALQRHCPRPLPDQGHERAALTRRARRQFERRNEPDGAPWRDARTRQSCDLLDGAGRGMGERPDHRHRRRRLPGDRRHLLGRAARAGRRGMERDARHDQKGECAG